jgi:2-C-methyl-D-erythritol 2,4-cyclodiphosphate synthase
MRVGFGFDVHKFQKGRDLVLGGVKIDHPKGLAGHSDADVLVHAIMDAMLGAAGLGDIGKHFPDTDPKYKGISSIELLKQVDHLVRAKGFRIYNFDATLVAETPKIAPHIETMKDIISSAIAISPEKINIKGTTTEGLGFTGRGEGIAAAAVVLLEVL